ncbi:MAG: toxin TcdB middle/N-terminal domain-containing protein, partial [Desulfobacteraceae bacterium]
MLITTDINRRPIFKYTAWLILYIFFINFLSYPVFAYPAPTKIDHKISVGEIINSVLNLFASEAEASEDAFFPSFGSGGTPNINAYTGSFSYSYPIAVPPGRGGLAPSLSLSYTSAQRDGWLGVGWDLTISSIERETKFGKPDYDDNDTFILKMMGASLELVKEGTEYRLKDESMFLRILKSGDSWMVTDKSGTKYYFGEENTNSRLDDGISGTNGSFRWYLNRMVDLNGNTVNFAYDHDVTNKQVYPLQIDYDLNNHVVFVFESKTDAPAMYNTFFKVKTLRRLKSIEVYHGSVSNPADLVRSYELTYDYSGSSSRSILTSIQAYGKNGVSLPAMTMEWPQGVDGFDDKTLWLSKLDPITEDPTYNPNFHFLGDFNGDGKSDFMWYRYSWRVSLSNGNGFDDPSYWLTGLDVPDGVQINHPEGNKYQFVADFNGDGMTDYMWYCDGWYVALSNGNDFNTPSKWLTSNGGPGGCPTINPGGSDFQFVGDFNGDGKTDYMWHYNGWHVALSNGNGFDTPTTWLANNDGPGGCRTYNSSGRLYQFVADFNGDGKSDYMWYQNNFWNVALSNGNDFNTPTTWLYRYGGPGTCETYNADGHRRLGDFNGDGKTDYMWYNNDWHVALSTGYAFAVPTTWLNANGGPNGDETYNDDGLEYTGDFNGDGKSDYIWMTDSTKWNVAISDGSRFKPPTQWTSDCTGALSNGQSIGDHNGDGKSDLMYYYNYYAGGGWMVLINTSLQPDHILEVNSPLGATTTVQYIPSSEWDNEYLPFKLYTVGSITTTDNQDHSAGQTYTYEGGKYDPVSREFRGFNTVTATDEVTGLTTISTYLQTQIYQGRLLESETWDIYNKLVSYTHNTWSQKDFSADRHFVYLSEIEVNKYDKNAQDINDPPLATITTEYEYSDDDYGNLVSEHKYTSDGISRFTRTDFLNDETTWVLGKPSNIRIGTSDPGPTGTQALRETKMTYDSIWRLHEKKLIHWEDSTEYEYTTSYTYDSYGNILTETDPRGNSTTIVYDSNSMFPVTTTNALGHTVTRTFDPGFGAVLTETDPNNQTTTFTYDEFGRKNTITYPDNSVKTYTYNISTGNHYTTVQTTGNPTATVYYDNFGRKTQERVTDGTKTIITDTTYDNAGRVTAKSIPHYSGDTVYWTTYQYDAQRGYMSRQDNPDSTYKTIIQNGLTETIIDEKNHSKTITKDSLGRLKKVVEATSGTTEYEYDIFNNLVHVKDPVGNITSIEYDDLGQKVLMDDPYMGHWEYDYDKNGNLIWQKDANLNEIDITYDELNRPDYKIYYDDNIKIDYTYDETAQDYYNTGVLTTLETLDISDPYNEMVTSAIEYNYDNMGREVKEIRTIDGTEYQTDKKYDTGGKLEYIIYPDSARTRYDYQYHGMGYLKEVRKHNAAYPYIEILDSDYNALGQMDYAYYGNGTSTTYEYYDGNFRLKNLITADSDGNDIQSIHYVFDEVGNIDTMNVTTNTDAAYTVNYDFNYDEVDRLYDATATCSNDPARVYSQDYHYDLAGNMIKKEGIGGWEVLTWESDYNRPRMRPQTVRFDYEVAGVGQRNILNNQDNKPIQISYKGNTTTLTYDGTGNRIKKVSGSETVIYVGGIFELRNGQAMSHIFADGKKIVTLSNGKEYYTHSDHLGSTSVVTDETGTIVEEIGYLPFGATLFRNVFNGSTWESAYRFTGQEFDEEYHLYNYGARLYDPIMCRFIAPDTIVPNWTNPQSLNRYSYCYNNPLIYVDPSGHIGFLAAVFMGAWIGGSVAILTGGNVLQGMLCGAISGGFFYGAGVLAAAGKNAVLVHAGAGAASGGINAAISGGNILQGIGIGAFSAGVSKYFGIGKLPGRMA